VVNRQGHLKRIDRLIVDHAEARIVDYKSSAESGTAQQEQVREYMMIVKTLYPGRKVSGFLVYLDTLMIEQVSE
jgi:ATP-dependent exoDNAse (exonuclease V) beta subunit